MNPFDHIKNLHTKKRRWEDFNDEEKKSFNIFIINKTLSFNPNYLNIVNMVQNYTGLNQVLTQKKYLIYIIHFYLLNLDFINGLKEKKLKKIRKKQSTWLPTLRLVLEQHTIT